MADGVDEGSAAMLGSVAEPAAWGVMRVGGGWRCIVDSEKQAAALCKGWDKAENWVHDAIPLYRSPTLTDAEREAVEAAARIIDAYEEEMDGFPSGASATLRGLLERTNPRLAALQKLTELDEELGLPRTPTPHSNQREVSVRPAIDSELVQ